MVSYTPTALPSDVPTTWDADLSDVFDPMLLRTLIGICLCFAAFYFVVAKILAVKVMWKAKVIFVLAGACLCIQDAIFDWLLIREWYKTGNKNWASWMLAAVMVGGYVSAELLRRRDDDEEDIEKRVKCPWIAINFALDCLGFSVIRTLRSEVFLKAELGRRTSEVSYRQSEIACPHVTMITNKLSDLMLCVHIGGIIESLLSFTVVSFCIITGTVSFHEDVTKLSKLAFLSWITSYAGILFKMLVFKKYEAYLNNREITSFEDQSYASQIRIALSLWFSLWFMSLCIAMPAFMVAQGKNEVRIPTFPSAVSKSVGLSYSVPATLAILLFVRHFYSNTNVTGRLGDFLEGFFTLWIVSTQILIQFRGEFRTSLGRHICWFWTIGAYMKILEGVSLLGKQCFMKAPYVPSSPRIQRAQLYAIRLCSTEESLESYSINEGCTDSEDEVERKVAAQYPRVK